MIVVLAIVTGCIFSMGVFMLLRRSMVKLIIGFILLSHAVNMTVFLCGNLKIAGTPIIPEKAEKITRTVSDPLPQALVLTAIVISFGLLAFSIVLIYRVHKSLHTEDLNKIRNTEKI